MGEVFTSIGSRQARIGIQIAIIRISNNLCVDIVEYDEMSHLDENVAAVMSWNLRSSFDAP